MTKTGRFHPASLLLLTTFWCQVSLAAIRASVDRTEVPVDESISLKVAQAGGEAGDFDPHFDAPDFEIMNQFQNSQFSSVYINGKFENRSETSVTFILRPKKVGALKIRNISSNGERAPEITVQVIQENLYKKPAAGGAPKLEGDARNFFVKAELSKARVYKGEQIVVSYYLYRRTRATVRDVMQYPSFQGFIREDLEMPILSNRPDFEAVNLGGIPFERALLARYAVYPIKDGKLRIDGFSVRVDYVPKNEGSDDMMEDPFFQFFTQVAPRTASAKSDPVTVDVLSLPEEGRSSTFSGGVGDYEIESRLEPGTIRANSPLTLHYTIRGKGNTNLVEFPQVSWPKEFKFYQAQGKSKNLGQGRQEKTFEVVVIPLQKGQTRIPPVEFEFFNPETRSYQKKATPPMAIEVQEGEAGSTVSNAEKLAQDDRGGTPGAVTPAPQSFGGLNLRDKQSEGSGMMGEPLWRLVSWFGLLVFCSFLGLVIWDQTKKRSRIQLEILKRKQSLEARWSHLLAAVSDSATSPDPIRACITALEEISSELYRTLDDGFQMSARAHSTRELVKILTDTHGVSPDQCACLSRFFEYSDLLRFSSGSGFQSPNEVIRDSLRLAEEVRGFCLLISRNPLENPA